MRMAHDEAGLQPHRDGTNNPLHHQRSRPTHTGTAADLSGAWTLPTMQHSTNTWHAQVLNAASAAVLADTNNTLEAGVHDTMQQGTMSPASRCHGPCRQMYWMLTTAPCMQQLPLQIRLRNTGHAGTMQSTAYKTAQGTSPCRIREHTGAPGDGMGVLLRTARMCMACTAYAYTCQAVAAKVLVQPHWQHGCGYSV